MCMLCVCVPLREQLPVSVHEECEVSLCCALRDTHVCVALGVFQACLYMSRGTARHTGSFLPGPVYISAFTSLQASVYEFQSL